MKRIILALAFVALAIGVHAQGITASNGTVVVKQGTVSIIGGSITASGTVAAVSPTTALTLVSSSVTTGGSVAAGAYSVVFETSGDFSGTIDGIRFLGNGFLPIDGGGRGTLPAIPYTINAGTLYIRKLTP